MQSFYTIHCRTRDLSNFENKEIIKKYENYLIGRITNILEITSPQLDLESFKQSFHAQIYTSQPIAFVDYYAFGEKKRKTIPLEHRALFAKYNAFQECLNNCKGNEEDFSKEVLKRTHIFLRNVSNTDLGFIEAIKQWWKSLTGQSHSEEFITPFQKK